MNSKNTINFKRITHVPVYVYTCTCNTTFLYWQTPIRLTHKDCIDFFQLVAGDCFGTLVKVKREQGSKYVKH